MTEFNDAIIGKRRLGTHDDPFRSYTITLPVINSKTVLPEIPNRFEKVTVTGAGTTMYEIEDGEIKTNYFKVDYVEGVVFFHSTHNNKNLTFEFLGEGHHYFPSGSIWVTNDTNGIQTAKEKFDSLDDDIFEQKSRVDNLIVNVPQPSETLDLRVDKNGVIYPVAKDRIDAEQKKIEDAYEGVDGTIYTSIKDRFDKTDEKISSNVAELNANLTKITNQLPVNVLTLGVDNTGTTDNQTLFSQIQLTHNNLFFPAGKYLGTLYLNNKIKISGVKPTYNPTTGLLENGTIFSKIEAWGRSDVYVENVGVEGGSNGFFLADGSKNIKLYNCVTNVDNHGYLLEETGKQMDGCIAENCQSYGGIHGFISKSNRTSFINCTSYFPTTNGFGLISDNMNGTDKLSNCLDNVCVNCKTFGESITQNGFNVYARDYSSSYSSSLVNHKNMVVSNFEAYDCVNGISIGEEFPSGGILAVRNIENPTLNVNLYRSATKALMLNRATYMDISGNVVDSLPVTSRLKVGTALAWSNVNVRNIYVPDMIISDNSITPSVAFHAGGLIKTQNTATTNIQNFASGFIGKEITVIINDDFSTIVPSQYTAIKRTLTGKGSRINLRLNPSFVWEEISRTE
jgi:hypothetical protein